jgi:hypothetical protein
VLTGRMGTLKERASVLANSSLHDNRENQPAAHLSRTPERRHSRTLLCYAAFFGLAAHFFVLSYEEPTLEQKFGDECREYRQRVPRWIPRF